MRTVTYKLIDKNKTICLGKVAENDATQVRFDAGNVFDEYPSAVPTLSIVNPEGTTYPGIVDRDEDMVTWNVQSSDVAVEGTGEIQLAFTSGGTVVRSYIYATRINRSIVSDNVPDPVDDWLTDAGAALYEIEHITASASGLPAGSDPTASYDDGTLSFGIPKGEKGEPGQDGAPGADGFSPTASVSKSGKVTTITITDKNGTTTSTVNDGEGGDPTTLIDDTSTASNKVWSANKVNDLKSAINNLNTKTRYTNSTGEGETTSIYVLAGQTVGIDVLSITGGEWRMWIDGYTGQYWSANGKGLSTFVPQNSGYLRFKKPSGTGTLSCDVFVFVVSAEELKYEELSIIPNLQTTQIKKKKVFEGLDVHSYNYSFDIYATIYNYHNYETSSSVAKTTDVIQIRDKYGNMIYDIDLNDKDSITSSQQAYCLYTFDKDGKFINGTTLIEFKQREVPFLNTEYYVILVEYPSVYETLYWKVLPLKIEWLNPSGEADTTTKYTIGSTGDYSTLTEALVALKDDSSNKILYIESGTYDIYAEMGGNNYFSNLPDLENSAWRTYCNLIPPNTKIIGIGTVVLTFNYPYTKNKGVFSCLNSSTGTYIENITVRQTGGRYGIHLEGATLSETFGNSYILKDVNVITQGANYSVGIGMNEQTCLELENCFIKELNDDYCFYHHTNHHGLEKITFTNCIIDGRVFLQNRGVGLGNKTVSVKFLNTYMQAMKVYSLSADDSVSDYDIVTYGVNNYTLTSEYVTPQITNYT